MARYMAFDYGSKRLGIAVTDPLNIIATGLETIHPKDILPFLNKYLQTEQVSVFVVGEPKQMDNTPSETAVQVNQFVGILKKNFPNIPIERVDERFTSKMALHAVANSGLKKSDRQNKERVDTISATIILQTYLEQKSFQF